MHETSIKEPLNFGSPAQKERMDSTQAMLTLAQELWIVKDRQLVLEAMLQERGIELEVDRYQPIPAVAEIIAKERKRFMTSLVDVLLQS